MMSSFEHDETFDLVMSLYNHGWDPVELGDGDGKDLSKKRSMTTASKTAEQ
jgi:hypothetical protein